MVVMAVPILAPVPRGMAEVVIFVYPLELELPVAATAGEDEVLELPGPLTIEKRPE